MPLAPMPSTAVARTKPGAYSVDRADRKPPTMSTNPPAAITAFDERRSAIRPNTRKPTPATAQPIVNSSPTSPSGSPTRTSSDGTSAARPASAALANPRAASACQGKPRPASTAQPCHAVLGGKTPNDATGMSVALAAANNSSTGSTPNESATDPPTHGPSAPPAPPASPSHASDIPSRPGSEAPMTSAGSP